MGSLVIAMTACADKGTTDASGPAADVGDAASSTTTTDLDAASCSAPGVTPVGVSFVNHRASAVTLYWIDGRCAEVDMGTLGAGRSAGLGTFVGHRFRVREGAKDPNGAIVREWTAQASDAPATTIVLDPPAGQPPVMCSTGGNVATTLRVENHRAEELSLFWVDGQCNETFRSSIPKGQSTGQSTFVGHVFRVRTGTATAPGALVREIVVGASSALDAGAGDAGAAGTEVVLVPEDGGAPTICSGPGTTPLTLTVKNTRATPIALYWLDDKCSAQLKETIAADASASESTYAGHVFEVRSGAQGPLLQQIVLGPADAPTRTVDVP